MDRGAWWATVHVVAESDTTDVTNTLTFTLTTALDGGFLTTGPPG